MKSIYKVTFLKFAVDPARPNVVWVDGSCPVDAFIRAIEASGRSTYGLGWDELEYELECGGWCTVEEQPQHPIVTGGEWNEKA